jgi:hypothetical protein
LSIFIGSIIGSFSWSAASGGSAQRFSTGVNTLVGSGRNAITGYSVRSVTIGGVTRSASVGSSSGSSGSGSGSSSSYSQTTNTGLIIGLVVGLCGGTILIVGSAIGIYKYKQKQKGRRLINEADEQENSAQGLSHYNNENTENQLRSVVNDSHIIRRTSVSSPSVLNTDNNRLHSPFPNDTNKDRIPSPAISITMLGHMTPNNQQMPSKSMPAVELIKFD